MVSEAVNLAGNSMTTDSPRGSLTVWLTAGALLLPMGYLLAAARPLANLQWLSNTQCGTRLQAAHVVQGSLPAVCSSLGLVPKSVFAITTDRLRNARESGLSSRACCRLGMGYRRVRRLLV